MTRTKGLVSVRRALLISFASALLAGCGGSQPASSATEAMPQSSTIGQHARMAYTQAGSKRKSLIYASSMNDSLYVLTYPSGKEKAEIHLSLPHVYGLCSDSRGNVFATAESSGSRAVYEFVHGGTNPIANLSDRGEAIGCSTDAISGNLAVLNVVDATGSPDIAVYTNATGTPMYYADDSLGHMISCAYNDKGDLFVWGSDKSGLFALRELPPGGSQFSPISLNEQIAQGPTEQHIQWDGSMLAITVVTRNQSKTIIYQVDISGSEGTVKHTIKLDRPRLKRWTAIRGSKLILSCCPPMEGMTWASGRTRREERPKQTFIARPDASGTKR